MQSKRSRLSFHQPREGRPHLKLGCYLIFSCLNNDAVGHLSRTDYIIADTLPELKVIYSI
jgi:hypothetical protein